ncbi:MAG: hypothetical protein AB1757_04805 [Acidobacteriota bacterium]
MVKKASRCLAIFITLLSLTVSLFSKQSSTDKSPLAPDASGKNQAQKQSEKQTAPAAFTYQSETADRDIAAIYAPDFYQAYAEKRFDYLTNFDFDGDWRGDNNWANAGKAEFAMKAFIYFAVSETATHYFIHYAVFHPRDYKGGERRGMILSEMIREGAKIGTQYDPTGKLDEAVLAHENDMEGCLVVVEKNLNKPKKSRVAYVETLAHNKFLKYAPDTKNLKGVQTIQFEGKRPRLFIEAKGHGMAAYTGKEKEVVEKKYLLYSFTGESENPEEKNSPAVGYDLLPLYSTLWSRAQNTPNETFGEAQEYQGVKLVKSLNETKADEKSVELNKLGSAFSGKVGAENMARPPWGWFDSSERERPLGEWFFNPAETIKRHFKQDEKFALTYTHNPFSGVFR